MSPSLVLAAGLLGFCSRCPKRFLPGRSQDPTFIAVLAEVAVDIAPENGHGMAPQSINLVCGPYSHSLRRILAILHTGRREVGREDRLESDASYPALELRFGREEATRVSRVDLRGR